MSIIVIRMLEKLQVILQATGILVMLLAPRFCKGASFPELLLAMSPVDHPFFQLLRLIAVVAPPHVLSTQLHLFPAA
jgi:hypothetical protein